VDTLNAKLLASKMHLIGLQLLAIKLESTFAQKIAK